MSDCRPVAAESTRPKRWLKATLDRVNVAIFSISNLNLRCIQCQAIWSPNIRPGRRLPSGYWKCPNGCNSPAVGGNA